VSETAKLVSPIKNTLVEFWQYKDVFYFLVWRNIKVRYKQTLLGMSWAVIQPFMTMVVFTIFFGKFAGIPSDGIPYPLFTYSALVPWTYFSVTLAATGNCLVSNGDLLRKVYFPRLALPVSTVISGLLDFAIASTVLFGMLIYYQVGLGWELCLLPVLVLPLVVLSLGVGMFLAALNVKFRDVRHVIPFLVQLWLFATPIIYPVSILPDRFRLLASLNPMTGLIEGFRAILLPDRILDWSSLLVSCIVALLVFAAGLLYFQKTEAEFADII
jgi:lipopolysaccharide transport system permease protein